MLLIYFDEVKYDGVVQQYEWISGIAVNEKQIQCIEEQISDIAEDCFGSRVLSPDTELHAVDIFNRKKGFKKFDLNKRTSILKRLALILTQKEKIKRISIRVDVRRLFPGDNAKERAFIFFVERANNLALRLKTHGMLIGDSEQDKISRKLSIAFSEFREYGTPYPYGQQINRLIDTVHFSESCSSRMLQLADSYAWFMQFAHSGNHSKSNRKELAEFLNKEADIIFPDTYKFWPTSNSWNKKY